MVLVTRFVPYVCHANFLVVVAHYVKLGMPNFDLDEPSVKGLSLKVGRIDVDSSGKRAGKSGGALTRQRAVDGVQQRELGSV